MSAVDELRTHFIIPDTQAKTGVPTAHLEWCGAYIVDRKPDVVVHLGDHFDGPSLSSYDVGKKSFEGRRYLADVDAANEAFDLLCAPLEQHNRTRALSKHKKYQPNYTFSSVTTKIGLLGPSTMTQNWKAQ